MSNNATIDAYPLGNGDYIARLKIGDEVLKKHHSSFANEYVPMVVILDQSSSMGYQVEHWVTKVLPAIFDVLGYTANDMIRLIMFHKVSDVYDMKVSDFATSQLKKKSKTYMASSIKSLYEYLTSLPDNSKVRILTVSDGEVFDRHKTVSYASTLRHFLNKRGLIINSQAVRLFTSLSQPDTRALSSVLQFNTINVPMLIDMEATLSLNRTVEPIVQLFINDHLNTRSYISTEDHASVLLQSPWSRDTVAKTISVNPVSDEQLIWLQSLPNTSFCINETIPVELCVHDALTHEVYAHLIKDKIDFYVTQVKLLQVINTEISLNTAKLITEYFTSLENSIESILDDDEIRQDLSLLERVKVFRKLAHRESHSLSTKMSSIVTNDRISSFNSAQSAQYLRSVDNTKSAKALTRRALKDDFDFTGIAHYEVRAIAENISELSDVDDSFHAISFCNLSTTLEGLRSLAQLTVVEPDGFCHIEHLTADEVLMHMNLVGIPVASLAADYPDPFAYSCRKIYPSARVSLSDVLVSLKHGNNHLTIPGSQERITNVIPFFDDERIQAFVMKYAPRLFSYTCSVGMRRVIANVPHTVTATLGAGLIKMIQMVSTDKSQLIVSTTAHLLQTFLVICPPNAQFRETSIVRTASKDGQMAFTGNYSFAQLLLPLMKELDASCHIINNTMTFSKHIQALLRAIYAHEVWSLVRRRFKNMKNSTNIIAETLNQFLGINFDVLPELKPLFNRDQCFDDVAYADAINPSAEHDEIVASIQPLDFLIRLPMYLLSFMKNDTDVLHSMETLSLEECMLITMGIEYPVQQLKVNTIYLSLARPTSAVRNDILNSLEPHIGSSLLCDILTTTSVTELIKSSMSSIYRSKYESLLHAKREKELVQITVDTVDAILRLPLKNAIEVWRHGLTKGTFNHTIKSVNSTGYQDIYDALVDEAFPDIADRIEKLRILTLGVDRENTPVWNQGNVLFIPDLDAISRIFYLSQEVTMWNEMMMDYRKRKVYLYRDNGLPNRHSHNDRKRSYWAMGYKSLADMVKNVDSETWRDYRELHQDCCGLKIKKVRERVVKKQRQRFN